MAYRIPAFLTAALLLGGPGPVRAQAPAGSVLPAPHAGGGILVAPTRLVFDDRKRAGEVNLTNVGMGQGNYRVSLVRMEMDDDGGCRELPLDRAPGQVAVQDMVRFSPREVDLGSQESQVVRVQVRKPADLPPGEYRLYMVFREEPASAPEAPEAQGGPPKGISIQLTSLFGVAIPVIIRHGETWAKVAVTELALDKEGRKVTFRLERTGNQSVHGDLKVLFQPASGKPQVLAQANGLSVFTPNAYRNMAMALDAPAQGARLGEGRIQVTFSAPEDQGGGLLAQGALDVR